MLANRVQAQQVVSDGTLNSIVTRSGSNFTITGGTTAGTNLFHSFREFSIPTGGTAFFDNATTVQNIFSRVTGGTVSNIDGIIRANGTANLFLLNPNGILFGANAQLNIGGSFIGTTAQSVKFADGTEFSAVNATSSPLLTISVPVGLQMGQNSGAIKVIGNGHTLSQASSVTPIVQGATPSALKVSSRNTLALIAKDIALEGGVLLTEQGHIELGSIGNGTVNLAAHPQGWSLSYEGVQSFQDIRLTQRSMLSDTANGSVNLHGRNLTFLDGSIIFQRKIDSPAIGSTSLNASETITLNGIYPASRIRSGVTEQTLGSKKAGDVTVNAKHLLIQDGGILASATYAAGTAGNLQLNVSDSVQVTGAAPFFSGDIVSRINSVSFGSGNSGNIIISTRQLIAQDGGAVATSSLGTGLAGSQTINASDLVMISGASPLNPSTRSSLSSTTTKGNAGSVNVNTKQLVVTSGGKVDVTTIGSGTAGSININASESVEVSGSVTTLTGIVGSQITAAATSPSLLSQQLLKLPPTPSGASGNITINTRQLKISGNGFINLENVGSGNAGKGEINADSIVLNDQGRIVASTQSGEGGNIFLQTDLLQLRRGSTITATAAGSGNGGNITLNAPIILGLENSDIVANAFQGRGGNIAITTQGVFGLKYRDRLTPENDITASSDFGVSGTVQVNNIGVDPNAGLVELSESLADDSQQVAQGCSTTQGSSFVITGRGGVPENPSEHIYLNRPWQDLRAPTLHPTAPPTAVLPSTSLPEATAWYRNPQTGVVELIATSPAQPRSKVNCAGVLK